MSESKYVGTIPDEAEFVADAKAFLEQHAKQKSENEVGWGIGADELAGGAEPTRDQELHMVGSAVELRRAKFDAGFGWLRGPVEFGGAGLPARYQQLFDEVADGYELPSEFCFVVGHHIVAPTLITWGTEVVKQRYLRALYRADLIACQLFSEPDAGSDLAGVKTKAVRVDGGWSITGQKVWTSGGHYSDFAEALVKTDPNTPRHGGLSMMVVDMHAEGVEARPLRQMTGGAAFNEVFLDNVFVPDDHVLGNPGDGWRVASTTLGNERAQMGSRREPENRDPIARLRAMIEHFELTNEPVIRQEFAKIVARQRVVRWTAERAASRLSAGGEPGAESSVVKLMDSENARAIGTLAGHILGPRMVADTGEWGTYVWTEYVLSTPSRRIAGGTDEIMRNIMSERILGLPREPKPTS